MNKNFTFEFARYELAMLKLQEMHKAKSSEITFHSSWCFNAWEARFILVSDLTYLF